ncbi:MAG: low-specificity L-threonine aldolase [Anaerolineae bacterium]|nr:low-specificity L-threonine aldolase [Anaerolineae bacterium]
MRDVDLRSDTVTRPTPAMWAAMAVAEVGDDVYGEDPTVNQLELLAAEHLGKEAALFVASGTQGNLVSLLAHCGRGDEVILGDKSHTFRFEQGGMAALGGIMPFTLPNQPDGTLRLEDIEAAIRPDDAHFPYTRLICLENTHNLCHGVPLTPEYTRRVAGLARNHGLKLHIDGARIFNAAAALEVDVRELVAPADSATFCLSKGLCAPVGSMVCGDVDFIARARRARKVLGGGMRQAGIIAAAGIIALEVMTERLDSDHASARVLAEGLAAIPGIHVAPVYTNMVYFDLDERLPLDAYEIEARLAARGVRIGARSARSFRAVTHYWIDDEAVDLTLDAVREVLGTPAVESPILHCDMEAEH